MADMCPRLRAVFPTGNCIFAVTIAPRPQWSPMAAIGHGECTYRSSERSCLFSHLAGRAVVGHRLSILSGGTVLRFYLDRLIQLFDGEQGRGSDSYRAGA